MEQWRQEDERKDQEAGGGKMRCKSPRKERLAFNKLSCLVSRREMRRQPPLSLCLRACAWLACVRERERERERRRGCVRDPLRDGGGARHMAGTSLHYTEQQEVEHHTTTEEKAAMIG